MRTRYLYRVLLHFQLDRRLVNIMLDRKVTLIRSSHLFLSLFHMRFCASSQSRGNKKIEAEYLFMVKLFIVQ